MPNQRAVSAMSVPNGTAPEERSPQMKRLSVKKMAKQKPGYASAVCIVIARHFTSPNDLYRRAEA
jgi:hypothetical protein